MMHMRYEDTILLKGMRFYGYHGVLPEEQVLGQWFEIDVELTTDLSQAGQSDDIAQTINYAEVYTQLKAATEGSPTALIEALADRLMRVCFTFDGVEKVKICVKKPQAPLGGPLDYCAVTMTRTREDMA